MKINKEYITNNEYYYAGITLVFDDKQNYIRCYSTCFDELTTEYISEKIKEILIEKGIMYEEGKVLKKR